MPSNEETLPIQGNTTETKKFSFVIALGFTLNYVMGTGFLTLPWAFSQVGIFLGTSALFVICFLSNIAKDYILETMARAEAMQDALETPGRFNHIICGTPLYYTSLRHIQQKQEKQQNSNAPKSDPILAKRSSYESFSPSRYKTNDGIAVENYKLTRRDSGNLLIKRRKYEIPHLVSLFLGDYAMGLYCTFISIYMYGTLWAYSSVFASSMATQFPLWFENSNHTYWFFILMFAMFTVPLSCREITEQITIQMMLTICRFVMVIAMVGSICVALMTPNIDSFKPTKFEYESVGEMNWKGLYRFLPLAVYGFIFHHSIPGLSEPVADKKQLGKLYLYALITCAVFYALIGISVSLYFGKHNIQGLSNLNWQDYHGMFGGSVLSFYIILFPALDVASAYPLNAITLANNTMNYFYGQGYERAFHNKNLRIRFRLLASIPPILAAAMVSNIERVTSYTGLTGFIITFIFPSLLQWYSRHEMKRIFQAETARTAYFNETTRKLYIPFVFSVAILLFVYIIWAVAIIKNPDSHNTPTIIT